MQCVSMSGCRAATTLCTYRGYGHFGRAKGFPEPMEAQIVTFFMEHACLLGGGAWSTPSTAVRGVARAGPLACACDPHDGVQAGGYCLGAVNVTSVREARPAPRTPLPAHTLGRTRRHTLGRTRRRRKY
jgi:hypothetical protein